MVPAPLRFLEVVVELADADAALFGSSSRYFFLMTGDGNTTHYLVIGEGDEWPSSKPLRSRLVTKGKDRFLLVEYPDSNVHWMEPKY